MAKREVCFSRSFKCSSGDILIVFCMDSQSLLRNPRVRVEKFSSIVPASVSAAFEEDWSRAYFIYLKDLENGGFYIEAHLDALEDASCASIALPYLFQYIRMLRLSKEQLSLLEHILSRKIFLTS
ncbi:MAG: hypothetical protein ABWW69_04245 [Pyrodictiaceae archaeon]